VPSGSGCPIRVQTSLWGLDARLWSGRPITIQPCLSQSDLAMPSWSDCVFGVQMSHRCSAVSLGSRCPTMVQKSHHNQATLSRSGPAVPSWSSHAIGVWMSHRGLDVPSGSRCPTMVQISHHNQVTLSHLDVPSRPNHVVMIQPYCAIMVRP